MSHAWNTSAPMLHLHASVLKCDRRGFGRLPYQDLTTAVASQKITRTELLREGYQGPSSLPRKSEGTNRSKELDSSSCYEGAAWVTVRLPD